MTIDVKFMERKL